MPHAASAAAGAHSDGPLTGRHESPTEAGQQPRGAWFPSGLAGMGGSLPAGSANFGSLAVEMSDFDEIASGTPSAEGYEFDEASYFETGLSVNFSAETFPGGDADAIVIDELSVTTLGNGDAFAAMFKAGLDRGPWLPCCCPGT